MSTDLHDFYDIYIVYTEGKSPLIKSAEYPVQLNQITKQWISSTGKNQQHITMNLPQISVPLLIEYGCVLYSNRSHTEYQLKKFYINWAKSRINS